MDLNIFPFFLFSQKFSLLHLASAKKILTPAANNENSADDSFEYVPPKVSYERDLIIFLSSVYFLMVSSGCRGRGIPCDLHCL